MQNIIEGATHVNMFTTTTKQTNKQTSRQGFRVLVAGCFGLPLVSPVLALGFGFWVGISGFGCRLFCSTITFSGGFWFRVIACSANQVLVTGCFLVTTGSTFSTGLGFSFGSWSVMDFG